MTFLSSFKKRLRIAYFTTGWPPEVGGPSSGNVDRVRHLARFPDIDVHVIVPNRKASRMPKIPQATLHTYESKPWPVYPAFHVPTRRGGRQIDETISGIHPDVVFNTDLERGTFLSSFRRPGRSWARRHGVPYLGYYHTDFYGFAAAYPGWKHVVNFAVLPALRSIYQSPDLVIAASPTAALEVEKLRARRVTQIPFDGVDTEAFTPAARDRQWLSGLIPGLGPQDQVILSFGRIAPEKHIEDTLTAFDAIPRQPDSNGGARLWLLVVGEGDPALERSLRRQAAQLDHCADVVFHGFLHGPERARVLASADIYVLPSTHETFSITTTEAMACGVPVVCARSGAMPTYVTEATTGFLHRPRDPLDQAQAMHRALCCDRQSIGRAARQTVSDRFSHGTISLSLRELFYREAVQVT